MTTTKTKTFKGVLPTAEPATAPLTVDTHKPLQYRGFRRGLSQVLHKDYSTVARELREALGITARSSLHCYSYGKTRVRADQADRVKQVFNNHGITDIWDA